MIKVFCSMQDCGKELDEPGAIILSPPSGEMVFKFHLCQYCYEKLRNKGVDEPKQGQDKPLPLPLHVWCEDDECEICYPPAEPLVLPSVEELAKLLRKKQEYHAWTWEYVAQSILDHLKKINGIGKEKG